jgi:hypothetical protein
MHDRVHHPPDLIYTVGTQVVSLVAVASADGSVVATRGAVGVVVKSPTDLQHAYRIRFPNGVETSMPRDQVTMLAKFHETESPGPIALAERIIFRCVIGSRAYGLDEPHSDTDRRGIYLPTAAQHWSLVGVPEQLENDATQEAYWELQKFLTLALKANPNVLECLFSPCVELATPLACELIAMREAFLSKLVYQTYNGYVLSQFQKIQTEVRNRGQIKWKHVMHLLRLLISGIAVLNERTIRVEVGEFRVSLLEIRRGEWTWDRADAWRLTLHDEFDAAHAKSSLPERPDYARVNEFLLKARRLACEDKLP